MNFHRSEFDRRYARLQAGLAENDLDALFVTSEANFNYFTGFVVAQPWVSYTRNLLAVLPREGMPVVIVPTSLAEEATRACWIERVVPHAATGAAPVDILADVFRDLGLERARIGAELGYEQRLNLSYLDFELLRAALPEARFTDASSAIWRLRRVKSPAEIDCLRQACAVVDQTFEQLFAEVRPGQSERQIAHRASELMLINGADRPGWVMLTSGPGQYNRTLGTPRDRVVQPGEMLWLDLSAIVNGYASDFCRAGIFGGPTTEQAELQTRVHEATLAGVDAIRPGIPASAIADACNATMQRYGLSPYRVGRLGHGLGLNSTEPPDVSSADQTILEAGMVLTVEPTVIRDDGIFEVEQNVVVTETDSEVLSLSPPHLRSLG